ncbi:hypothetical protein Krac_9400 [Ktedonobacter racemifer DSM 44963]|uniref:Uncharacterized protein n=1 Tax=Ktedonobacter racemifer DSM 44963 TaxID=485913 RepID=D6TBZ2_KTERA|nr:hypothetical protein Krac_9400 [Ktedonobacter racemifer DSM 44963]
MDNVPDKKQKKSGKGFQRGVLLIVLALVSCTTCSILLYLLPALFGLPLG